MEKYGSLSPDIRQELPTCMCVTLLTSTYQVSCGLSCGEVYNRGTLWVCHAGVVAE